MASVLGLALGGVVAGHWLAYAGAEHTRRATVAAHAWLAPASRLALVAVIATLAAVTLGRVVRPSDASPRWASVAAKLFAFQATAFLAVEVSERLIAGSRLHDLPVLLPLGIAAQALVAVAGAWLFRTALRAGNVLGDLTSPPAGPQAPVLSITATVAGPWPVPAGVPTPVGLRAPPLGRT